jgi:hypothetical protein
VGQAFQRVGDGIAASGRGEVTLIAPFISSVMGTDTYADAVRPQGGDGGVHHARGGQGRRTRSTGPVGRTRGCPRAHVFLRQGRAGEPGVDMDPPLIGAPRRSPQTPVA